MIEKKLWGNHGHTFRSRAGRTSHLCPSEREGSCDLTANCIRFSRSHQPHLSQENLHPRPPAQGRAALGRLLGEERREHVHITLGVQVGGAQKLARRQTSLLHIPAIDFIARGVGKLNCTTHAAAEDCPSVSRITTYCYLSLSCRLARAACSGAWAGARTSWPRTRTPAPSSSAAASSACRCD